MLLGSYIARIDEKFRLKLPAKFRRDLTESDGTVFVTSDDGRKAQVYPISVWEQVVHKLLQPPRMDPAKLKFERLTSYYGAVSKVDGQGRILIPQALRDSAEISGDVVVIGGNDHLEVWNKLKFEKIIQEAPLTDVEREHLGALGI